MNASKVDVKGLLELNGKYNDLYPLLKRQSDEWSKTQPLKGLRILHVLINSHETLLKLQPLILGGADVTVVDYDLVQLPYQKEVNDIIKKLGITLFEGFEYDKMHGEFDFILDCQARSLFMPNVKATRAIVEYTQLGADNFEEALKEKKINVPVINIDQTPIKEFECIFGTGDAFIRAFKLLTGDIPNKRFLIVGYGKVGKGICLNLVQYVSKENIAIVVRTEKTKKESISNGFSNSFILADQINEVKDFLKSTYAIVTATKVKGLLGMYLSVEDTVSAWLANMGLEDEFGDKFKGSSKLLADGYPINFKLVSPTRMRYLDPNFWTHNRSIEIYEKCIGDGKPKIVNFPHDESLEALKYWSSKVESLEDVKEFLKAKES